MAHHDFFYQNSVTTFAYLQAIVNGLADAIIPSSTYQNNDEQHRLSKLAKDVIIQYLYG